MVYVGKITNTHGLKGELRILSTFSNKEYIFRPGFKLYIEDQPYEIVSTRRHKNYDMVIFKGYDHIDDVLFLKGKSVYFKREDIQDDILLETDFIGMKVVSHKGERGVVTGILEGVCYNYLIVERDKKEFYLPNLDEFILKVSPTKKTITIKEIEGLLDEN